jgi:hypothetical protein
MKCPACGVAASGNFCASCGQSLATKPCSACGVQVLEGSRFCTGCGAAMSGGTKAGAPAASGRARSRVRPESPDQGIPNLGWWVAGALLVVTILALGYPILTRSDGPTGGAVAPPGMGGAGGGAGAVDLTTMSLEEQGTVLFNRVMGSSSAGDSADVEFFLPKALVIYGQLNPADPDGLYHYALLHQVGGDFEAALAKAGEGLAQIPDYLLLLAVAAEASVGLGNESAAQEYYGQYLDVFDAEMELMRPGYEHHTSIFPVYREEALAFLGRR